MLLGVVSKRFLPYILSIVMILGVGYWIWNRAYNSGVDDTVQMYEQKIQEERKRLLAANVAALETAKMKEAELRKLLNERNDVIRNLMQEAFSDPNANSPSLGIDSVRRINRIR